MDAVDFIAELRQAGDLAKLPVGRRVVVIGGGMTAIDVAYSQNCSARKMSRSAIAGARKI